MTDKSKATQGRVRITYEADSITPDAVTAFRVAYTTAGAVLVPADATVEPLEDLCYGDVVVDDGGVWFKRTADGWVTWAFDGRPGMAQTVLDDGAAVRPFRLHFRNGKPVQS